MNTRAGHYRTNLSGDMAYESFVPHSLSKLHDIDVDAEMNGLLLEANVQMARLDEIAVRIPSLQLFVSMYVRKEALLSSQIEGTQCTLEDVFDPLLDENANRDVGDVINYIKATEFALGRMTALPLCNRLFCETHAVLLSGVRGQEKDPGHFRHSQNWIGGQGSTLRNARYVPPCPEDMVRAMSDLEKYINDESVELDPLIRIALIHYQFETIHPFLDGNGRIGRLMILLYLLEKKLLKEPVLYVSYYLKQNRTEYYDRITEVRTKGNYEQWIKFFLQALTAACQDAIKTIDELTKLRNRDHAALETMGRARGSAIKLLYFLENHPIIEIGKTAQTLDMSFNTVSAAVKRLTEKGILRTTSIGHRNRIFGYEEYLKILGRGT